MNIINIGTKDNRINFGSVLPASDNSWAFWQSLKPGTYFYNGALQPTPNMPSTYGIVEVLSAQGEGSATFYQQAAGNVYRKSWNGGNYVTGWDEYSKYRYYGDSVHADTLKECGCYGVYNRPEMPTTGMYSIEVHKYSTVWIMQTATLFSGDNGISGTKFRRHFKGDTETWTNWRSDSTTYMTMWEGSSSNPRIVCPTLYAYRAIVIVLAGSTSVLAVRSTNSNFTGAAAYTDSSNNFYNYAATAIMIDNQTIDVRAMLYNTKGGASSAMTVYGVYGVF